MIFSPKIFNSLQPSQLIQPPGILIYAVEIEDAITISERLTPKVHAALPGIIERIIKDEFKSKKKLKKYFPILPKLKIHAK
jgi:hypothetical protein